jgi:hypothetical protein
MAIDDRFVVMTRSNSARIPGIMKSRLSSSGLNQTRTSARTSGTAGPRPVDAASSRAYDETRLPAYPSATLVELASVPSATTCTTDG